MTPLLFAENAAPAQSIWSSLVVLVFLAASAAVLAVWQRNAARGRDFFGPRDPASAKVLPWGKVVALGFLAMFVSGLAVEALFIKEVRNLPADINAPERLALQFEMTRWRVLGNVVLLAFVLGVSFWQEKLTAGEQKPWHGLIPNRRDVRDGILMGLASVPLLMMLQGLLQYLSKYFFQQQIEHPYIEMLRKSQERDPALLYDLFSWVSFSVIIIAPVLEELLFRGLLQGWLRGKYHALTTRMLHGPAATERVPSSLAELQRQRLNTWAPIFITSLAFTAAHVGTGPAMISLFFFSLALGYVYEKTGRLAPSIITHLMLNLCTTIMLWLMISGRIPAE